MTNSKGQALKLILNFSLSTSIFKNATSKTECRVWAMKKNAILVTMGQDKFISWRNTKTRKVLQVAAIAMQFLTF